MILIKENFSQLVANLIFYEFYVEMHFFLVKTDFLWSQTYRFWFDFYDISIYSSKHIAFSHFFLFTPPKPVLFYSVLCIHNQLKN